MNILEPTHGNAENEIFEIIRESITIRTHFEFLLWAQGGVQKFLPHRIMIAAWGELSLGTVYFDIVSDVPNVRTSLLDDDNMVSFIKRLYGYWMNHGKLPFSIKSENGLIRCRDVEDKNLQLELRGMRSALIHAIRDARGGNDCMYILLNDSVDVLPGSHKGFQKILPYLDYALRQIELLPKQIPYSEPDIVHEDIVNVTCDADEALLSEREIEIMTWVRQGKTNSEIGSILDISAFTVKNHLKRIFRKLNVYSRSQAVAVFQSPVDRGK